MINFDQKDPSKESPMSRGFFSELFKEKPAVDVSVNWKRLLPMLSLPAGLFLGWKLSSDLNKRLDSEKATNNSKR